jgi:tRNA pseudouridine38-40 synthase
VQHLRLTIAYDGTCFHGSQRQRSARTVQGELESGLERVTTSYQGLAFAGRTDRGVHAVGQVATVDVEWSGSMPDLRTAINAVTGDDLQVVRLEEAPADLHARYSAKWREYRYRIVEADVLPVLQRRYAWWRREELDPERAAAACSRIVGRHQFGTFASLGLSQKLEPEQLTRTVMTCEWRQVSDNECEVDGVRRQHELRIVANGFLPQMVRNIVSAMHEVARGEQPVDWVESLIGANDRRALGKPAPPQGLMLWRVGYEDYSD